MYVDGCEHTEIERRFSIEDGDCPICLRAKLSAAQSAIRFLSGRIHFSQDELSLVWDAIAAARENK